MLRSAVLAFKSFNGQPTGTQSSWLQCWSGPMLLRYFCAMREHRCAEIMFLFHTIPWWSWWRSCFRFEYSKVLDLFDGVFDHEPEGALLCSLETTKDLYMLMKKKSHQSPHLGWYPPEPTVEQGTSSHWVSKRVLLLETLHDTAMFQSFGVEFQWCPHMSLPNVWITSKLVDKPRGFPSMFIMFSGATNG